MFKFIAISLSVIALALGWWFTTYLTILCWMAYGAAKLLAAGAKGGAFDA